MSLKINFQNSFKKKYGLLSKDLKNRVEKALKELERNPYHSYPLGKTRLRKKRINRKWRLIFTIQDHQIRILDLIPSDGLTPHYVKRLLELL